MRRSTPWLILLRVACLLTGTYADTIAADNATAALSNLQTWWHENGEINYETPVQESNVRQSHVYSAWVKSTADTSNT